MSSAWSLPTVVIAGTALRDQNGLAAHLQSAGYLVLECHDRPEAVEIARLHSRPIHIMLMDDNGQNRDLASMLLKYRPQMRILFINWAATESQRDTLAPHMVLRRVQEILSGGGEGLARAGAA